MEFVFGIRVDGNNPNEPPQLGIWNCKNDSEQSHEEGKFMTSLKFATLPTIYWLTLIFWHRFNTTFPQYQLHIDFNINMFSHYYDSMTAQHHILECGK
jgi:hypothetical protein